MKIRHSSLDCCFVESLEGRKLLSSVADGVVPALDFSRYHDFEIECPPPGSLEKRPCSIQAGMIQGRLFDDSNGNGVRDSGEAAVQGAAVLLTRQSGDVVEVLRKEITDALGGFIFGLLRPGQYTVTVRSSRLREIESRSIEVTIDDVETQAIDVGVKVLSELKQLPTKLKGTVFFDANGNGIMDKGEKVLPGVAVFVDANGNGKRDADEPLKRSNDRGRFSVSSPEKNFKLKFVLPRRYHLQGIFNRSYQINGLASVPPLDFVLGVTAHK